MHDMNYLNPLTTVIVSILYGSIVYGVISYIQSINDHSSTIFGAASRFWFLAVFVGVLFGAVTSGVSAAIIVGLKLRIVTAALLMGIINLLVVLWFLESDGQVTNVRIRYMIYSLIPLGLIQGAILAYFGVSNQVLE